MNSSLINENIALCLIDSNFQDIKDPAYRYPNIHYVRNVPRSSKANPSWMRARGVLSTWARWYLNEDDSSLLKRGKI